MWRKLAGIKSRRELPGRGIPAQTWDLQVDDKASFLDMYTD